MILIIVILAGLLSVGAFVLLQPADNLKEIKRVTANDSLSSTVLMYAINGYRWAVKSGDVANSRVLTIVDFNRPSNKKRLWVIDLKNDHVLMHIHKKASLAWLPQKISNKNIIFFIKRGNFILIF